jgi:hypothetical protein
VQTSAPAAAAPASTTPRDANPITVRVAFRHVHLRVYDGIALDIRRLDGALVSHTPGQPPIFDDETSFTLRVDSAEMAMSVDSLTRLLNEHTFNYPGAPLSDLKVTIDGTHLKQSGTLHKGVPVPFSVTAEVSATADGKIRLHPVKTSAAGIPAGGLMKLFHLQLDDLISLKQTPGVSIAGDDFLLSPDRLLPEPPLSGHLTGVRLEGQSVVQTFGPPSIPNPLVAPAPNAPNFMYYRGGSLRFGKLTMSDADMELIDADPSDVFDFWPEKYLDQLVAGYSKNTRSGGLLVYMPDYNQAHGSNLKPGRGSR